jgi:glycosyltransferase involved in cell wall biosynthesis
VSEAEVLDLPGRPQVAPNGVEALLPPEALTPEETLAPRAAPTSGTSEDATLLFVGSDARQKRGLLLVDLLAALPRVRLRLAGRFGPRFVRTFAPFGGRVTWSGVLDDAALAAAYGEASLVVHPAVGEAFGLVPFEAALLGTAAVVAGGHGCGEWYGRAGGCVVPPDDAGALIEAVRSRLQDPGLAAAESRAVAAFASGVLTWERAAEAVERVYAGLVDRRRGRGAA